MSLSTWKREFYTRIPSDSMSEKQALKHSIKKWTGLLKINLDKHGLKRTGQYIEEKENPIRDFRIFASTCALCVKHISNDCKGCSLFKEIGGRCDSAGMGKIQPFAIWVNTGNPRQMIKSLKDALEKMEKK